MNAKWKTKPDLYSHNENPIQNAKQPTHFLKADTTRGGKRERRKEANTSFVGFGQNDHSQTPQKRSVFRQLTPRLKLNKHTLIRKSRLLIAKDELIGAHRPDPLPSWDKPPSLRVRISRGARCGGGRGHPPVSIMEDSAPRCCVICLGGTGASPSRSPKAARSCAVLNEIVVV